MKSKRISLIAVAALVLFAVSTSFGQNLVNNSGFETGDLTGWTPIGNQDDYTFVDACSYSTCPHSGDYQTWFGAVYTPGGIQQSIATNGGSLYEVSFWLANDGTGDDPNDHTSISVTFDGVTLVSGNDQAAFGYTFYDFFVTASGSNSLLSFNVRQDPAYYYLDDVSVTEVRNETPEPASLTLLGSALGLGAGFIRKFRS